MKTAFVICGALAREVLDIAQRHSWNVDVVGVSALDHLVPERIAPDVEKQLLALQNQYERVIVVYGDCGTGGALDEMLRRHQVERVAGPHCYEMYGGELIQELMNEEPGTFLLTDFLVRSFRGTVMKGLGLDRFPELVQDYFRNYRRVVYLVQNYDQTLIEKATEIAAFLELPLEVRRTGYGRLEERLIALMETTPATTVQPAKDAVLLEDIQAGQMSKPGANGRHRRSTCRTARRAKRAS
jgi:hypothetical protein